MTRIAIVTGASRGIGRAIAERLATENLHIVGTATSKSGADRITEFLDGKGQGNVLDVSNPDSIDSFFEQIKGHDAPQVLVNNAGITRDNLALRMKDDEWQSVIDTNLTAIFRVTKRCLRGMTKAKWGRVINLSSVVASMGNGGQSNYAAAKAGIEGYSRSLASELGSRGVTVNCVAPGFIETDMTKDLSAEQAEVLLNRVPAGRLGNSQEIAGLVAFLVSEEAGYITGETIHINGGMYMS